MNSSDIRKQCARHGERQPCFICGLHRDITEAHHVMPLEEVASVINNTHLSMKEPPVVWLCPNCHTYLHSNFEEKPEPTELKKYFQILDMKYAYLTSQIERWFYG